MFQVQNMVLNFDKQVTIRDLGYGQNDILDLEKDFIWKQNINEFLKITTSTIDEFILQCKIDDQDQSEPDITFLKTLQYPDSQTLAYKNPREFSELILDYDNLLLNPFFSKNISQGYAINRINSIQIQNQEIQIRGSGYFFG